MTGDLTFFVLLSNLRDRIPSGARVWSGSKIMKGRGPELTLNINVAKLFRISKKPQ